MNVLGIVDVPTWLVVIFSIVYAYYKYMTWTFGTLEKLGIRGPKPYPIVGSLWAFFSKGLMKYDCDLRQEYGKVVGVYQGREPMILIYDPAMLKQIMVKHFNTFYNRRYVPTEYPVNTWLTVVRDEQWKRVRNHVTPAFSGSKLRRMTDDINRCALLFRDNMAEKAKTGESFDFRKFAGYYTMDVIASTGFGLQVNSQVEVNNPFVHHATRSFIKELADPRMIFIFLLPAAVPYLSKLGIGLISKESIQFYESVVDDAMKQRQTLGSKVDLMQLMLDAHTNRMDEDYRKQLEGLQKDSGKDTNNTPGVGLTKEEVLGQSVLFFFAGFETTALTIGYMGYNLALNPQCQERLLEEIDTVMAGKDVVDYDLTKKMPYLTMCMEETLRMYPAGARVDRTANEDITIDGLFIPKGMLVSIPIYAIHHDPELWPDPEKFDPERFSPEAKAQRDPFCFLPFGMGPRNCVGMRLAMMEIKAAMAHILLHYKFATCPETEIPVKMTKATVKAANGVMLRIEARR